MSEERYVAAIEISSSKIIGTVGIPREEGVLEVIAVEQERCTSFVRMGFISNIEETAHRISQVLQRLQKKSTVAPRKITKVFIGLSGRSMRSIPVETELHIPEDSTVDIEIVKHLKEQAMHTPLDGSLEMIDCVPRSYLVDKRETQSPIGWVGHKIEATYDLIVSRPELKRNILRTFDKLPNVTAEGFIVTAMATGQLLLSEDEKQGCILVDMGAETTSVSIYLHGALYYYVTLPMGSRNITRDITTLRVTEERAEDIKITTGNAIAPENPSALDFHGLKQSEISDLIVARAEEIVANIIAQIQYAGLTNDDLTAGIILIGGGSKLNGMTELLKKQSYHLTVRRGELPQYITILDTKVPTSETIEVVSVLYAAVTNTEVNCVERPQHQSLPDSGEENEWEEEDETPARPEPKEERKPRHENRFVSKLRNALGNFFTVPEDEDDSEID